MSFEHGVLNPLLLSFESLGKLFLICLSLFAVSHRDLNAGLVPGQLSLYPRALSSLPYHGPVGSKMGNQDPVPGWVTGSVLIMDSSVFWYYYSLKMGKATHTNMFLGQMHPEAHSCQDDLEG